MTCQDGQRLGQDRDVGRRAAQGIDAHHHHRKISSLEPGRVLVQVLGKLGDRRGDQSGPSFHANSFAERSASSARETGSPPLLSSTTGRFQD